jgi:hypothetical protein
MTKPVTFWLNPEQDQDLIDWLASFPKGQRSQSIRSALRAGIEGQQQDKVNAKLDRILAKLVSIDVSMIVQRDCSDDWIDAEEQLPDALLSTLGGLGK